MDFYYFRHIYRGYSISVLVLTWMMAIGNYGYSQEPQDIPSFDEMVHFCKTSVKNIEQITEAKNSELAKITARPISQQQKIHEIIAEEKNGLQRVTASYKKLLKPELELDLLIRLGLFDDAIIYLESDRAKPMKDISPGEYYLHLAFVQRWLEHEPQHTEAIKNSNKYLSKKNKKLDGLKTKYEIQYKKWVTFSPQWRKFRDAVRKAPENITAWEQLADYSRELGYRLEEIVAVRFLYERALQQNKLSEKEVLDLTQAYFVTLQSDRILEITDFAMEKNIKSPAIYEMRIKAYLLQPSKDTEARREYESLKKDFPRATVEFHRVRQEVKELWSKF